MTVRFNPSEVERRFQPSVKLFLPDGWAQRLKIVAARLNTNQQQILFPVVCAEIERLEKELAAAEQNSNSVPTVRVLQKVS